MEWVGADTLHPPYPSHEAPMALLHDLEVAAVTLPLDTVLEVLRGLQGKPVSVETLALMKIEVASVLCNMPGIEDEVIEGLLREAFGAGS